MKLPLALLAFLGLGSTSLLMAAEVTLPSAFPGHWSTVGRVTPQVTSDSVILQDGFISTKETTANCDFSFRAQAPQGTDQVQIWAAVRVKDRDNRYVFGLRGGNNNDVYLARYSPDGNDSFLGVAPLDFKPVPGTWYKLRAVVSGNQFLIYVNDETIPRINVVDPAPLWNSGGVALGGGWLPVEFKDVTVVAPAADALSTQVWQPPTVDKEARRVQERAAYQPRVIDKLNPDRTEIPLNGKWLFMPEQDLDAGAQPVPLDYADDQKWHVMDVPAFWNPGLSWLYGETGFKLQGISASKGICDNLYEFEQKRLDNYTFDWKKTKSAWYRHYFVAPPEIAGRRVELDFDAIAKISEIWVNGTKVGGHTGMFGESKCDLSSVIHPGNNVIVVHVIGQPDKKDGKSDKVLGVAVTVEVTSSMVNSMPHGMLQDESAGIWQPVKLVITSPVAVNDLYIRPKLDGADFDVEVRNSDGQPQNAQIFYVIRSNQDGSILTSSAQPQTIQVPAAAKQSVTISTAQVAPKLWSPEEPNLYQLELQVSVAGTVVDKLNTEFGFRTFGVDKNRLMLNGKPYWLRGGNHFPSFLMPNDPKLAAKFIQLAREGNVRATRSHGTPMSETWLKACDEYGMGVSYEGTWPWLMLAKGPPPDERLLTIWKTEFSELIHKYRNHPSILLWTVNNEMKFEDFQKKDTDPILVGQLKQKWTVLNDMIKTMRKIDPTRSIVADSSYTRASVGDEYKDLIQACNFDDGDIDDEHAYDGWYNPTFFHFFKGELGKNAWPDRPLISQEMSTGYSQNDDGHPCRAYLFNHQTPQSLVGNEAYENRDPQFFLQRLAFSTKELAETFRRANRDNCSGILHFAYITWFKDVWNSETITPFPPYYGLQTALQPVLVSAELYGRHFYAGTTAHRRVCVVNDADDYSDVPAGTLTWEIQNNGQVLSQGTASVAATGYYTNQWLDVDFAMPATLPSPRIDAQLVLKLTCNGKIVSHNSYDIVLANSAWTMGDLPATASKVVLFDPKHVMDKAFSGTSISAIDSLDNVKPESILILGDAVNTLADAKSAAKVKQFVQDGGKVLMLHPGKQLAACFPDQIKVYRKEDNGEIVTMHIPESPVFTGLEPMDLAWFEMGPSQLPFVCRGVYTIDRTRSDVVPLADEVDIHGYLKKAGDMAAVSGSPIVEIDLGQGRILASEMMVEASPDDPIARRLLANMILTLMQ